MKVKNTIATSIFGFLFSLAILFPCIVQFTHFFEEHENVVCAETAQHIHEKKIECEIHDFHITHFNCFSFEGIDTPVIISFTAENEQLTSIFYSEKNHDFLLRGPPALS
jgi:hypothetical protein